MNIYKRNRITGEITPVYSAYDGCLDGSAGAEAHRLNRMNSDKDVYYVQMTPEQARKIREADAGVKT